MRPLIFSLAETRKKGALPGEAFLKGVLLRTPLEPHAFAARAYRRQVRYRNVVD